MKVKYLALFTAVIFCVSQFSCKLDPPIYPDDPDFVTYNGSTKPGTGTGNGTGTGTGTGNGNGNGTGTETGTAPFKGTWTVSKFYELGFMGNNLVNTTETFSNWPFSKMAFNNNALKVVTTSSSGVDTETDYTTDTRTITFAKNPFLSVNNRAAATVVLTQVTPTSMTMTFTDQPTVIVGVTLYVGARVVLTKQ